MTADSKNIAVLTGDLAGSTGLGSKAIEQAMMALEQAAHSLESWQVAPAHFTRQSGDGWQVALNRPEYALRAALYFRASVKALGPGMDVYIGIAEGNVSGPLAEDLNRETSAPFVVSGRALAVAKRQQTAFHHGENGVLDALAIQSSAISDDWTSAQAETISLALHPLFEPNHTRIAEMLGKSRQAVSKALKSAKCDSLRSSLTILESDPCYG